MGKRKDHNVESRTPVGKKAQKASDVIREIKKGGNVIHEIRASLAEGHRREMSRRET